MESQIVEWIAQYQSPIIFFGSVLFGESVILSASYLSAQGLWMPITVFFWSLLGTVASDTVWFLLGSIMYRRLNKRKHNLIEQYAAFIQRVLGKRPFLVLLFIKFLYGTRILTIVYLSFRKLSLWKFTLYNTIGTMIWLCVLIPIGYYAALGVFNAVPMLAKVQYTLPILLFIVIACKLLFVWIQKLVIKR